MIGYTPSHLTENEVILEKLNQIIDYLIKNPSYQVYAYNGGFISGTLTYEIANIINSNNINVADVVVFNNGYYGIISEITETEFTLTAGISLIGPQGPQGVKGDTGPQGPKGDTGTIPEALPQEASALKSGELPTSAWGSNSVLWTGSVVTPYKPPNPQNPNMGFLPYTFANVNDMLAFYGTKDNWSIIIDGNRVGASSFVVSSTYPSRAVEANFLSGYNCYVRIFITGAMVCWYNTKAGTITEVSNTKLAKPIYTISDTSITANSDVLMELTDEGGVKANALASGSITVIRDTVPTQAIPYTYKVKQTNASGQFTLVNHFVPSIPESPTSLPVTYKKVSGSLPTSGWTDANGFFFDGGITLTKTYQEMMTLSLEDYNLIINNWNTTYINVTEGETVYTWGIWSRTQNSSNYILGFGNETTAVNMRINKVTRVVSVAKESSLNSVITKFYNTLKTVKTYTISDTSITANTSVKMYLTDEGGVKAYSKESGAITVIRDEVPTTAIPYEYEVEQTSDEGLFEVINDYVPEVPTKTSQLQNDSGFITSADIPSAGEWVLVTGTTATLTEAGTYQVWRNLGGQILVYWDGQTQSSCTLPCVSFLVNDRRPYIHSYGASITADGVLSITHESMTTDGTTNWTQSVVETESGFKYRKIN